MVLTLNLPNINVHMKSATFACVYAAVGDELGPGAKLFDLSVDLSAAFPQDCPPISYYRIVLRERAWLRQLDVRQGDEREVGGTLALFTGSSTEPLDSLPRRPVRFVTAGILYQSHWTRGRS
ncbi:MAG: hypothetical protein ACLPKB_32055 [Xanthobacteraceae bacterium]